MNIRKAKKVELNKVVEFYHQLIDDMQDDPYHPAWEKDIYPTSSYLKESISDGELFIMTDDNKIIASVVLNHKHVEQYNDATWLVDAASSELLVIHLLGIGKDYQKKGLAKELVNFAINFAKENKLKTIRLDAMKVNLPAQRLYTGMGFKFIAEMTIFYEDTRLAEFLLYEYPLL